MTRSLTATDSSAIRWTVLMKLELPDGTVNLWAGPLNAGIVYNGETYVGLGDFGSIDKLTETSDGRDARTVAKLRLLTGQDIADGLEADATGSNVTVIIAFLDSDGAITEALEMPLIIGEVRYVADPSMDGSGVNVLDEYIEAELVSPISLVDRTLNVGLTYVEQLEVDSSDHSLEFVADPANKQVSVAGVNYPTIPIWGGFR